VAAAPDHRTHQVAVQKVRIVTLVANTVVFMVLRPPMGSHHITDVPILISIITALAKLATQRTTNALTKLKLTIHGSGFFLVYLASAVAAAVFTK